MAKKDGTKDQISELSAASRDRLRRLGQVPIESPAFVSTRVLANLEGRRSERRRLLGWRLGAVAGPALALLVSFWAFGPSAEEALKAKVGRAYAVKVSLESLDAAGIAVARIELPPGVKFHSKSFSGLEKSRFLEVPGETLASLGSLPLVIEGSEAGTKSIIVRFLDGERNPVFEKEVLIRFEG